MNLFQLGEFRLNSGAESKWKLECDALTDDDIKALAEMIRQMVGPFSSVEGVPRGGLRLAEAMKSFATEATNYHLIVDDVLTTGNSMNKLAATVHTRYQRFAKGAVVFARGKCPHWVMPLFSNARMFLDQ